MLSNLFAEHVDVLHALLHDKIDEVPAISVEFDEGCRLLRVDGKARLDHFLRVVRTVSNLDSQAAGGAMAGMSIPRASSFTEATL